MASGLWNFTHLTLKSYQIPPSPHRLLQLNKPMVEIDNNEKLLNTDDNDSWDSEDELSLAASPAKIKINQAT